MKTFRVILIVVGFAFTAFAGETNAPASGTASTNNSSAIADHREKYLALEREYEVNYSTIITNEPRRYALVQAELRERAALVNLGYLVEVDFPFSGQWSKEFEQTIHRASFEENIWAGSMPHVTNGLRIVHIWARPNDIPVWKRIIAEHNSKTVK